MSTAASGGTVALMPRPLTEEERIEVRRRLAEELPRLARILGAASDAAVSAEPESALVFLGMLAARAASTVFPR